MDRGKTGITGSTRHVYYSYRVSRIDESALHHRIWDAAYKGELSINYSLRLCAFGSHIRLESQELAEMLKAEKIDQWRKQWGSNLNVIIVEVTDSEDDTLPKIQKHSEIIKRLLGIEA